MFFLILPANWILYFLVALFLYQLVFRDYPGIAFAGRSILWVAACATPLGITLSLIYSPGGLTHSASFATLMLIDRFVLFAIAFFAVLLVSVMVRYPISVPRNAAVHCICFGGILSVQTICQVADQWSMYHFTPYFNTIMAAIDAILGGVWAASLTHRGDEHLIRIRHSLRPETELLLLGQLRALNGVLLPTARK